MTFLFIRQYVNVAATVLLAALVVAPAGGRGKAREDAVTAPPPGDLPRYRFAAGQEMVFERAVVEDVLRKSSVASEPQSHSDVRMKWWVWVTRQNADGWRLVVRKQTERFKTAADGEPQTTFSNDFLSYVDLYPDGTYEPNPTLGGHPYFKLHPSELFPVLPPDTNALRDGWSYSSPEVGFEQKLRVIGREGDVLRLSGPVTQLEDAAYQMTTVREFDFDVRRGLATKLVTEIKSDWPKVHERTAAERKSLEHRGDWIKSFAEEAEAYFTATKDANADINSAGRSPSKADCRARLDKASATLAELRAKAQVAEIQEVLDMRMKQLADDEKYDLENAAFREKLYGMTPAEWETTGYDGDTYSLDDFRGKVVIMDFWYRACPHCIKAFPKIKELASQYAGRDVVVAGINNDKKEDDARFMIEQYGLDYLNLRAGAIPNTYGVRMWPTVVVLDQTGRVAGFQPGNSEELVPYVTEVVDKLLANPRAEPPADFNWTWGAIVCGAIALVVGAGYVAMNRLVQGGRIARQGSG